MPRIFDNIANPLLPALKETLTVAERADFCVGYFNLRGWRHLAPHIESWTEGKGQCYRLLIGMYVTSSAEVRRSLRDEPEGGHANKRRQNLTAAFGTDYRQE